MTKLALLLNKAKYGLEAKMTLHIVATVVVVSLIITAIAASMFQKEYEHSLNHELDDAIESTERLIEDEISTVETATLTAANVLDFETTSNERIESALIKTLKDAPSIMAYTVALDHEHGEKTCAVYNDNGQVKNFRQKIKDLIRKDNDQNWIQSYTNGKCYWSVPYDHIKADSTKFHLIAYSVPIVDKNGQRCGILASNVTLDWLTTTVMKSKSTNDIDVAIKASNGKYIVEPGPIAKNNAKKDLIVKEHHIDRLGWTFIISSPRSVITHRVWKAVWKIVMFATLLILFLCISIIYNVRHVARPFVNEQKKIAQDKASIEKEISMASDIQRKLLTLDASCGPQYDLKAILQPAKNIGGDLYDYTVRDGHLYFCIGDVSGKGMSASLFMAMTTVLFRHTINTEKITSPAEIVKHINTSISLENPDCMFVTFFTGKLNLATGELQYCNAGHNTPIIDGEYIGESSGMPLGIDTDSEYEAGTIQLKPGSKLLLYTDGVTEAVNIQKEEYGEGRLIEITKNAHTMSPTESIETILSDLSAFSAGAEQFDDITMMCIKYN